MDRYAVSLERSHQLLDIANFATYPTTQGWKKGLKEANKLRYNNRDVILLGI